MALIAGLDLESTGTNPLTDRIVEIAVELIDLESGYSHLRFARRINPGIHIPAASVEIHGITDADVMGAPTFDRISSGVASLLARVDLIVAHNGLGFDGPLLLEEMARVGTKITKMPPIFDTMLLGRCCTLDGKVPNLGELCFALDVDYDPSLAHQALYDVEVMLKAFQRGWQIGAFRLPDEIEASG